MLKLISRDVTVSAKSANKLFKRAKIAGVDFTDYTVYSDETIVAVVQIDAGGMGYASRNGSPVWQARHVNTIQNVRLFVETNRLRNHGIIPTDLTPLLVVAVA